MASWGSNNDIGSAPTFVDKMVGYTKVATAFANTTGNSLDAFSPADASGKAVHTGWVYTVRGTGGRNGRVQRETLVTLAAVANTTPAANTGP